jgi:hypothetical protein
VGRTSSFRTEDGEARFGATPSLSRDAAEVPSPSAERLAEAECAVAVGGDTHNGRSVPTAGTGKALSCRSRRGLGLFRDFYEPVLNEACGSRHSICVDRDPGKQVAVAPAVRLRGCSAQLDFDAAFHEVGDQILIGIAGGYIPL